MREVLAPPAGGLLGSVNTPARAVAGGVGKTQEPSDHFNTSNSNSMTFPRTR